MKTNTVCCILILKYATYITFKVIKSPHRPPIGTKVITTSPDLLNYIFYCFPLIISYLFIYCLLDEWLCLIDFDKIYKKVREHRFSYCMHYYV